MQHQTTERRAQLRRDYALQITGLRTRAHAKGFSVVGLHMREPDGMLGGIKQLTFSVFPRHEDNMHEYVKVQSYSFKDAFRRAQHALDAAMAKLAEEMEAEQ